MDLASWLDDEFYKIGSIFPLKSGEEVLLAKGGKWLNQPSSEINLHVRDFYTQEALYFHPRETLTVTTEELRTAFPLIDQKLQYGSEATFFDLFQKDYLEFKKNLPHLRKIVLTSRKEYTTHDPLTLKKRAFIKAIHGKWGEPYGFWFDDYAMIGSTPEHLFEIKDGMLETFALAGTALKENVQDLISSQKIRHEHDLVVTNIREDLNPICEKIDVFETVPSYFAKLVHLKTKVRGILKNGIQSESIIKALSPTAALGGYPRSLAKSFLQDSNYHSYFPKRYHGSVLALKLGHYEKAIVMIRNIQLHGTKLILEAGAGIVESSHPEEELQEIQNKMEITREILL